ncbi:MAG TPA: aminotransferase class V-fold PLP-dependent enzyme [Verrucomicrobiae bacterium]|nr:aminotransferase class V-fold PLP-dependent enzyme [Verrucomicrobiae bacterium]
MTIDIAEVRRDTPATAKIVHFNNAGAALPPQPVVAAQIAHIQREAEIGGYEAATEAQARVANIYASIARLIGANADEIALVENATVGWDMAFYAVPLQEGDRILTAQAEYSSNYIAFLQRQRQIGFSIEVIPNTPTGEIDVDALARMIDGRVKLIAITHVPTNGGLVNPAAEIGKIARQHGILYLLDACQSVGQMPVDVNEMGCDLLSATGRKYLRGPRGSGFLYVRRAVLDRLEPPFLDNHAADWTAPGKYELRPDARRFENWENNYAAQLGLGAAVDYTLDLGLENIAARVDSLAALLRQRLSAIPGLTVADIGRRKCGIVSMHLSGKDSSALRTTLRQRGFNCSVSTPASTLLDATARRLPDVLRASVHYYNTEEEVERFTSELAGLARS